FAAGSGCMAWTARPLATAGLPEPWPGRLMLGGPATMGLSLTTIALLTPHSTAFLLVPFIALLGAGIGQCWPFVAHRIMDSAKEGNETAAASSVATVQHVGSALAPALAGLRATAS